MQPDRYTATPPCGSCETFVANGARFCGACGRSLAGVDAPKTTALHAIPHDPTAQGTAGAHGLAPVDPTAPTAPLAEGDPLADGAALGGNPTEAEHGAASTRPETGADASTVDPLRTDPAPRPKRWRKWTTIGVAVVLVLALVGFAAQTHLQTRDDLTDTRADLASTSETLASTEETLEETSSELEETTDTLEKTEQQLQTRTDERDALQSEVQSLETHLEGVRGSLANAEERISLQSGEITNLRSCLQGVGNALVYLADGYLSAALGAIEAVEISCRAAMDTL